jgi:uncharacterized repeat protein (TIGR01451 family)
VILLRASGRDVAADRRTTTDVQDPTARHPAAGILRTDVMPAELPTGVAGPACLPIITPTKTTSTPLVTNGPGGTNAIYTLSVSNAAGLGTAIGLNVSDVLPAGFTYASTGGIVLSGGANRTSISDPTAGDPIPSWGVFELPGGGQIEITFTVDVASTVPDGTYQNPATASYLDPQRSTLGGTTSSGYDPSSSLGDVTVVRRRITNTATQSLTPISTDTPPPTPATRRHRRRATR